jgi:predicted permease
MIESIIILAVSTLLISFFIGCILGRIIRNERRRRDREWLNFMRLYGKDLHHDEDDH